METKQTLSLRAVHKETIDKNTRKQLVPRFLWLVISLTFLSGMIITMRTHRPAQANTFTVEYPLPVADAQPHHIIAQDAGHLWFTLPGINAVGSLIVTTTLDYKFDIYTATTAASEPHDLILDEVNGYIWFTQRSADQLGRLEIATGQIEEYALPTESQPTGLALADDGLIWLTLPGTNQIASFNQDTEVVNTITYDTADANFTDIEVAANGLIWVVSPSLNRLVSYNPTNGVFVRVIVGDFGFPPVSPHSLVMQGNTPWITVPENDWLGRYSPGTLNLWIWYTTADSTVGTTALAHRTVGTNQELWYLQPSENRIGRQVIDNRGRLRSQYLTGLPTPNSRPEGIAVDDAGVAWVTATEANAIASWQAPYVLQTYLPLITQQ